MRNIHTTATMGEVPVLTLCFGEEELDLERVESMRMSSSMRMDPSALQHRKKKSKKEEALEVRRGCVRECVSA